MRYEACNGSGEQLKGVDLWKYGVNDEKTSIKCPICKRTLKLRKGLNSGWYMIPRHKNPLNN